MQTTKLIRSRSGISPAFPYRPLSCFFLNHKRSDPRFRPAAVANQESSGGKQQPRDPAGREHGGTTNPNVWGLFENGRWWSMTRPANLDLALAEEIRAFYTDPLGFVMFAYPWSELGGELENLAVAVGANHIRTSLAQ